jgi:hypothetical protein
MLITSAKLLLVQQIVLFAIVQKEVDSEHVNMGNQVKIDTQNSKIPF